MDTVWREFRSNASIHGIKLATSPRLSVVTRLMFGSVLIASAALTVLQIVINWEYYRSYPLQVVEEDSRTNLGEIDFPAVTVCSVFKIKMSRANEHIDRFSRNASRSKDRKIDQWLNSSITLGKNATYEEKTSYWNSLLALSMQQYPHYNSALEFIKSLNSSSMYPIRNQDIPDIMKEVSHRIEDLFAECHWRGKVQNCSNIFKLQRTEEGFCYSFNSRTAEYSKNERITILNNSLAGRNTGLAISLKELEEKMDWRLTSLINVEGYNVIIDNPEEIPDSSSFYRIKHSNDQIHRISIKPKMFYADNNLKDIPSKVRDCYWIDKSNEDAEIERNGPCHYLCRRDIIWDHCHCIPYFFHAKPGMEFCGIEQSKCLADVNVILRNLNYHIVDKSEVPADNQTCNCKKLCTFVSYETQLISSPFHLRLSMDHYVQVDVSYFYQWGQTFRKELKFTFKDLSVTVGGYASLLLGCSLITILEVLYSLLQLIRVLYSRAVTLLRPGYHNRNKVITISHQDLLYAKYPFLP